MKRLLLLVAAVFASLAVAAPAASAKPEPVGGCGEGFELMSLKTVLRQIAAEDFEPALRAADKNADEFLCVRILANFPNPFEPGKPVFVFTDNDAAL